MTTFIFLCVLTGVLSLLFIFCLCVCLFAKDESKAQAAGFACFILFCCLAGAIDAAYHSAKQADKLLQESQR